MDLALLTAIGANLIVWAPETGKIAARGIEYIKSILARVLGSQKELPKITLDIGEVINDEVTLTFTGIAGDAFIKKVNEEYEASVIPERTVLEEFEKDNEYKKKLSVSETQAKIKLGVSDTVDKPEKLYEDDELYTVTIKVPKDKLMGEIYFGNINQLSAENIIITRGNGDKILDSEREFVLRGLEGTLFALSQNLGMPNCNVKVSDIAKKTYNAKTELENSLRIAGFDYFGGKDIGLTNDKFTDYFVDLVLKLSLEDGLDILKHYYDKMNAGIVDNLQVLGAKKRQKYKEIAARSEVRDESRRKLIVGGVVFGSVLVLGVLAAVFTIVFWPAGIVAGISAIAAFVATGGIGATIIEYLGKLPWAGILGFIGAIAGLAKVHIDYQNEKIKIAEEEKAEIAKGEEVLDEAKRAIEEKKPAVEEVLKFMDELNDRGNENETLSIDFNDQPIGDLGLSIIYGSLTNKILKENAKSWQSLELSLSNCKLTANSSTKIANMISDNRLALKSIDLSGDNISADGMSNVVQALENNLTITVFKYGNLRNEDERNIVRHLILNKYVQSQDAGVTLENLLEGLDVIQCGIAEDIFKGNLDIVKAQADAKVRKLYNVYSKDIKVRQEFAPILQQNECFRDLMKSFKENQNRKIQNKISAATWANHLISAFKLNSNRCSDFVANQKEVVAALRDFMLGKNERPEFLMQELSMMNFDEREKLLRLFVVRKSPDIFKKINLLAQILDVKDFNESYKSILNKAFSALDGGSFDDFKKILNDEFKNALCKVINDPQAENKLLKFLDVYKKIPDMIRQSCLHDFMAVKSEASKLLRLVENDMRSNNSQVLNDLKQEQKKEFLDACASSMPATTGNVKKEGINTQNTEKDDVDSKSAPTEVAAKEIRIKRYIKPNFYRKGTSWVQKTRSLKKNDEKSKGEGNLHPQSTSKIGRSVNTKAGFSDSKIQGMLLVRDGSFDSSKLYVATELPTSSPNKNAKTGLEVQNEEVVSGLGPKN